MNIQLNVLRRLIYRNEDSVKNEFSHARFVSARTWHKLVMRRKRAQK